MAPLLVWVGLALSFVIGLAAVVRMSGPLPEDDLHGVIRLPGEMTATIVTLFSLAVLVYVGNLIRRGWSRKQPGEPDAESAFEAKRVPMWVRLLRQVLSIAYFLLLAYMLSRSRFSLENLMGLRAGAGSIEGFAFPRVVPDSAPPFITWTFGILALGAGIGALALALWVTLGGRLGRREPAATNQLAPPPLLAAVEESVEDLRSEPDARRAIVRCYARFEHAAADSGVARKPWVTPAEFVHEALGKLPAVPRAAVPTLTGLFELARFSHHALGQPERDRAVLALDEIKTAMTAARGDAAAS